MTNEDTYNVWQKPSENRKKYMTMAQAKLKKDMVVGLCTSYAKSEKNRKLFQVVDLQYTDQSKTRESPSEQKNEGTLQ